MLDLQLVDVHVAFVQLFHNTQPSKATFQVAFGKLLALDEHRQAYASVDYPKIPPCIKLQALYSVVQSAWQTSEFAQQVQEVDQRIVELRREKRGHTERQRTLKAELADKERQLGELDVQLRTKEQELEQQQQSEPPQEQRSSRPRRGANTNETQQAIDTIGKEGRRLYKEINSMQRELADYEPSNVLRTIERLLVELRGVHAQDVRSSADEHGQYEYVDLGLDRFCSRYVHVRAIGGILVHHAQPLQDPCTGEWSILSTSSDLDKLVHALNLRGKRERTLRQNLERLRLWIKPTFVKCRQWAFAEHDRFTQTAPAAPSPNRRKVQRKDAVLSFTPAKPVHRQFAHQHSDTLVHFDTFMHDMTMKLINAFHGWSCYEQVFDAPATQSPFGSVAWWQAVVERLEELGSFKGEAPQGCLAAYVGWLEGKRIWILARIKEEAQPVEKRRLRKRIVDESDEEYEKPKTRRSKR
jgi:hypothetical protein